MHQKIWQISGPIMLANITTPLLGAVDIAMVGHLPGPEFMAAVGIGATIFSTLFFGFSFLRMGTTGLVSIAYGGKDTNLCTSWLIRSLILSGVIGGLLWLFNVPILKACNYFISPPDEVIFLVHDYFSIRVVSSPAALANFALLGWLIGVQSTKIALYIQLLLNLVNIILNFYFVLGLELGVKGVAYATLIAEYVGLGAGLWVAYPSIRTYLRECQLFELVQLNQIRHLFFINTNIFIRSFCLQIVFLYFTVIGATFGSIVLAVNAVLMNFQLLMAYALDGFANAAEALTGEAIGLKQINVFKQTFKITALWAISFALIFSLVYALSWKPIVFLLTDVQQVRQACADYIHWAILLPIISVWSFHLDGVFIGATITKPMRNGMVFSLIVFFMLVYIATPVWGNHGLWFAFCLFMIVRALTLAFAWPNILKKFH